MGDESTKIAESRITAQGQISIPSEVRRRLGVGPGSLIEWDDDGAQIIVRRAGRYSSRDIHELLFPGGPPAPHSLDDYKAAIRARMRRKHAGR